MVTDFCVYLLNGKPVMSMPRAATSVQIRNFFPFDLKSSRFSLRSLGLRSPCKQTQEYFSAPICLKYRSKLSQSNFVRQKMMALKMINRPNAITAIFNCMLFAYRSMLCALIARMQYSAFSIFTASEKVSGVFTPGRTLSLA